MLTASFAGWLTINYDNYSYIIYWVFHGIFPADLSGPKRDNVSDGNGFTISYSIAAGSIVNNNIASMFNRPNAASTLKWNVSNLFLFSISGYKYILHIYAILLGALSVFRGLWSGVSQERSRQSN